MTTPRRLPMGMEPDDMPDDHGAYRYTSEDDSAPGGLYFDCLITYSIDQGDTREDDEVEWKNVLVPSIDVDGVPCPCPISQRIEIQEWLMDRLQDGKDPAESIEFELLKS